MYENSDALTKVHNSSIPVLYQWLFRREMVYLNIDSSFHLGVLINPIRGVMQLSVMVSLRGSL